MYEFQDIGVSFLRTHKSALLADEPGLGKTIQAIRAVNELCAKKVLVVCPAVVKLNWERELQKWLNPKLKIQVLNGRKDKILPTSQVVVLNYDLLISPSIFVQLIRSAFSVGIFDESHYLKSRTAKRTKAVLLQGGVASRCVYRWFLTGTPVLNRPVELYPVLKACAPTDVLAPYLTFDSFARRFCGAYWDGFQLVATGATHMDELNVRLSKFMLRRLKKDHLKELPDKQYQLIAIPPSDAKTKALVKREFTFSQGDARKVAVGVGGAELAVMRHELALSKVDTCVEHIKSVLEEKEKVVVFAYHKGVIAALKNALSIYGTAVITGDTSPMQRQDFIDEFQHNKVVRVFIGQIQAAGIGITLTAASHVIFVETDWVPGVVDQAIDRCHRIGQKDSVMVQFLVIQDSLEEYIVRTMIDKKENIQRIVDQDPEVSRMCM